MTDWRDKYNYHFPIIMPKKHCGNCDAFKRNHCRMFDAKVKPAATCDEWTKDFKEPHPDIAGKVSSQRVAMPWQDPTDPNSWEDEDPYAYDELDQDDPDLYLKEHAVERTSDDWRELQPKTEHQHEDWSNPYETLHQHLSELKDAHGINLDVSSADPSYVNKAQFNYGPSGITQKNLSVANMRSPQHYIAGLHEFGHALANSQCLHGLTAYDQDWNHVPYDFGTGIYQKQPGQKLRDPHEAQIESEAQAWRWAAENSKVHMTPNMAGMMHHWLNTYNPAGITTPTLEHLRQNYPAPQQAQEPPSPYVPSKPSVSPSQAILARLRGVPSLPPRVAAESITERPDWKPLAPGQELPTEHKWIYNPDTGEFHTWGGAIGDTERPDEFPTRSPNNDFRQRHHHDEAIKMGWVDPMSQEDDELGFAPPSQRRYFDGMYYTDPTPGRTYWGAFRENSPEFAQHKQAIHNHIQQAAGQPIPHETNKLDPLEGLYGRDKVQEWSDIPDDRKEWWQKPGTEAHTAGADHDGCMVALMLSPESAKKLHVEGGEPDEDMHITMAYFSDAAADRDDWEDLHEILKNVAHEFAPFEGEAGGTGSFEPKEKGGAEPYFATPDVPGLPELHVKIREAVEQAGFPLGDDHGWHPHITLKYVTNGKFPEVSLPVSIDFPRLSLMVGGKRTDFEFGDEIVKTSSEWSDPNIMYHVSHPRNHESIMQRGLVPGEPSDEYAKGVYLWHDPYDAGDYYQGNTAPLRLYEVNTEGLDLKEDPLIRARYTEQGISPDRITPHGDVHDFAPQYEDDRYSRVSSDWNEGEHPRDTTGRFTVRKDQHEVKVYSEKGKHTHTVKRCAHCGVLYGVKPGEGRRPCPTCGENPERKLRLVEGADPSAVADSLGWRFWKANQNGHRMYQWEGPNEMGQNVKHVVTGGGTHGDQDFQGANVRKQMRSCMNGTCNHVALPGAELHAVDPLSYHPAPVLRAGQEVTYGNGKWWVMDVEGEIAHIYNAAGAEDIVPVVQLRAASWEESDANMPGVWSDA